MFHKFCVFLACAGLIGVAGATESIQQVITSEVFEESGEQVESYVMQESSMPEYEELEYAIPTWPIAGSEADVEIACDGAGCADDTKIVTKMGSGLVIENNINTNGAGWSGGPDIMNGIQIPVGFDYECANDAEMPLMRREMMEDDGGSVLAMSRSPHKNCKRTSDSYAAFAQRAGFMETGSSCTDEHSETQEAEVAVNEYVDEESSVKTQQDEVRSWVVVNGQTLREVLQSWCDKEGWDLVWTTAREYPIEASAVFKGRFIDVASALVRNFERATPIPYAKFYKGNRVIVISTTEE